MSDDDFVLPSDAPAAPPPATATAPPVNGTPPEAAADEPKFVLPSDADPSDKVSPLAKAIEPITSIPATYQKMVKESIGQMGQGVSQIETGEPLEVAKGLGNVALGGLGYVTSPINAPLHTIVGRPIAEATGSPAAGTAAEIGASFLLPVPKGIPKPVELPEAPFGVTLSKGEAANDLALRQREAAAIRNAVPGTEAWTAQRAKQLQDSKDALVEGLDPARQILAETPQEAGQLVSQGVQNTAAARKAAVAQAYAQARALPGEIHAGVFQDISQGIRNDLTLGDNPVIIDDKTTPFASKMIDDLNNGVAKLQKATPVPDPQNITGINLDGVDQMRKRLSSFRKDAYASGNAADGRAAQAVIDAFDDRIDQAVNGGRYTGDPAAVAAWNNARAAYADYRSTFTAGRNDPVGRVVQKIIGDNVNDPLTSGKVMDQIVGSSANPTTLNIGVANRLKSILGEQSPEWIATKQGVAQKLMQAGEGETALGTGQIAQRMSKFLNSDMAGVIYSPQEQETLRAYANLMRRITMPPGSYFPSAPPIQQAMAAIRSRIGGIVGALIGHAVVPIPLVGELAGLAAGSQTERALERLHSGITKQLPIVADRMQQWNRAKSALQVAPNPIRQRAAVAATMNLQRALTPLGIDLKNLAQQGPGTAQGAPNQNNIVRPPAQQKHGGAIDQQGKSRAQGGKIREPSDSKRQKADNPQLPKGARLARDGNYYLADPHRPGKYLKVVSRARRSIAA